MSPAGSRTARVDTLADFRELFVNEFSWVCRTLRRLGVRSSDLEDAAQEVFVAVHRRLDDYDDTRPLRPWLAAFAYRVAKNQSRLAKNRKEVLDDVPGEPSADGDPEQRLDDKRRRELVLWALSRVELDRRAVLVMHDIDAFTAPEIAEALGIPVNTVYSRLRVARRELKDALTATRPGEEAAS